MYSARVKRLVWKRIKYADPDDKHPSFDYHFYLYKRVARGETLQNWSAEPSENYQQDVEANKRGRPEESPASDKV